MDESNDNVDRKQKNMSLQRSILGFLARGGHLSHRAGGLELLLLLLWKWISYKVHKK